MFWLLAMALSLIYALLFPQLLSEYTKRHSVRKPDTALALTMFLRTLPPLLVNMPQKGNHIKNSLKCSLILRKWDVSFNEL